MIGRSQHAGSSVRCRPSGEVGGPQWVGGLRCAQERQKKAHGPEFPKSKLRLRASSCDLGKWCDRKAFLCQRISGWISRRRAKAICLGIHIVSWPPAVRSKDSRNAESASNLADNHRRLLDRGWGARFIASCLIGFSQPFPQSLGRRGLALFQEHTSRTSTVVVVELDCPSPSSLILGFVFGNRR